MSCPLLGAAAWVSSVSQETHLHPSSVLSYILFNLRVGDEDRQFWQKAMAAVDRPSAMQLLPLLDWNNVMGIPARDAKKHFGKMYTVSCRQDFIEFKSKYPQHIILMRIGDFYESAGFDAVMLVQYTGLNPMGLASAGVAKAGCPKMNVRRCGTRTPPNCTATKPAPAVMCGGQCVMLLRQQPPVCRPPC